MNEYIFSVIIPHKNTLDLLQRCLDSIPRRKDIQIIVVDDNSDEDKVDFDRFPYLEDEYVEIYLTKEGKGAGYARNVGMTQAKGKWLLFADADDFLPKTPSNTFLPKKIPLMKSSISKLRVAFQTPINQSIGGVISMLLLMISLPEKMVQ